MVLVSELCPDGNLETHMVTHCPPMPTRVDLMEQMSCGMLHLHSQNPPIAHKNIKPQNVLIKKEGPKLIIKICDFGFEKKKHNLSVDLTYMAPEALPDTETDVVSDLPQSDVFSLGLLFQAMVLHKRGESKLRPQLGNYIL